MHPAFLSRGPDAHWRFVCILDILGRPATFATAHEAAWKAAVRAAVTDTGIEPMPACEFLVRVEFRTPVPRTANERWDLDNLVKPTLDALEGVFGLRPWQGAPQPNDDRVVRLEAGKRIVLPDELPGAHVEIHARTPTA